MHIEVEAWGIGFEIYDFLALRLASLAMALSARSTPTNILEAFQSWTRLIMFFKKHMGKLMSAIA